MTKYLAPLGIFIGGNILVLVIYLILPTVGNIVDADVAGAGDYSGVFWQWGLISSGTFVKFLVMFIAEMLILFATAKAFLKTR